MVEGLRLSIEGGVATLTMCKGENRFDPDYLQAWHRALDVVERQQTVRALITTGEGRFFSSGLDLQWLKRSDPAQLDKYHDDLHSLYKRIISLGIITVAAINGHAIAEGAFIALVHDFRIMRSDRGWIQWPEVHARLPMTTTMLDIIRAKLSQTRAIREAVVFGKRLDAATARDLGVVDVASLGTELLRVAMDTINTALGKGEITRDSLEQMKRDIYTSRIREEKLAGKL